MSAPLTLSILDFQHPGSSVSLACAAEEWGFRRYWLGEHHTVSQCANPLLLGALLAGTTSRIRIGTGGVSLAYRTAMQTAEDARLIEFMIPGRFDLGVTRGLIEPGPVNAALLEGRAPTTAAEYTEKVRTLHGLVTGRIPAGHPLATSRPYLAEEGPPFWVLGLSPDSARLAGSLGAGFCFSVHHALPEVDGPAVLRAYRESFVPSPEMAEPASIIVVRCICGGSEAEAKSISAHLALMASYVNETILGSARQCAERIAEIAESFSTNEVMIVDFVQRDQDVRREMYRLLSQELDLPSAEADDD